MFGRKTPQILLTGIDIGSSAIRIAVGQYMQKENRFPELNIIGMVEVPSEGVQKGVIVSIEETVSSLSNALEQIERLTGVMVEHAWIGISGVHILSQRNQGVVAVAKSDGEISQEDVDRVVEAARTVSVPLNHEILHVIPLSYGVDGQTGIKDPIGMTGIRLEVNAQIIFGLAQHIKHITKAVYRTGIDIDDLVLSILATGDVVTSQKQKELGVAVVNIGSATTSIVVYENNDVVHTAVLPIGSDYITNDIAIGLRTSIEIAEKVKIEYGHCLSKDIPKKEQVDLAVLGSLEENVASLKFISEIVEARVGEILGKINNELKYIERAGKLPAGIVFTGGGAKISGLVDLAKQELLLPASLGYPMYVSGGHGKVHDISFSSVLGLIKWGASIYGGTRKHSQNKFSAAGKLVKKAHDVWQSLMP
jgi:cell division protein FtsA